MRRLREDEGGFGLLLALAVTVIVSILAVSATAYTTSNSRSADLSRAHVVALTLAAAGIDEAVSVLHHAPNAALPTLLGCSTSPQNVNNSAAPCTDLTVSEPGGTASFHGLYTQGSNTGTWSLTGSGLVADPAGRGDTRAAMTATVTITGGGQSSNNISVWNYVYSTAPQGSGCELTVSGTNVVVDVPLYVTGDLCLSGTNAVIQENTAGGGQKVDVRVEGSLTYSGTNATVGSSSAPITSGFVKLGCKTNSNGTLHPCTSADKWYVGQTDGDITATPPTTDFPGWYANASPGPDHTCDPALTPSPNLMTTLPNAFDGNGTMDGTNTQFDLTPSSSYNCVTSSGQISWNSSAKLLTVSGTLFFDGSVTSSSSGAMYHGKATIYVNGALNLNGTNESLRAGCPASPATPTRQCAFSDTAKEWDPNTDNILFVLNKSSGSAANLSGTNVELQAGLLCSPTSTAALAGTNVKIEGPIICGKFSWGTNTKILPLPTLTNLPPGAPVPPNAPATIAAPVITGS
ncbi:MAG: hypothetical protein ACYDCH_10025 [Gaiellaceae bacterium]